MEPKFTKGPLEVVEKNEHHGFYVTDVAGRTVCDLYFLLGGDQNDVRHFDNAEANAHLIAAAPDMYAALEELVSEISSTIEQYHRNGPHWTSADGEMFDVGVLLDREPLIEKASAALSRARGETK